VRLYDGIILQQVVGFGESSTDRLTGDSATPRYVLLRGNDCRTNEGILE
jgi:hypothetical protein